MKKKTTNACHLYLHFISINIKSMMQYKMSFLLSVIGQFLVSFNVFLGIHFMFQRFPSLKGFTYSEVLLCYGIVLMEYSMAEMYARGFDMFPQMIKNGGFDRVLVRPRNETLQVLASKFELTRIGRMLQAIILFFYGIMNSGIHWTFPKILTVLFMLAGGSALFSGFFLIYASLCFFTLDGLEFMNIFTDGAKEYGKYPISVYGEKALLFCTILVPYALVQYYPLLYLVDKSRNPLYVILPLAAMLFLIPCHLLWRFGVRHYRSSGS